MEKATFKILSSPYTYVDKQKMIAYHMGKEYKVEKICLEQIEVLIMRTLRLIQK